MKNKFSVFFSWQSDVKGNKTFIERKIKDAVKEIAAYPEMNGCTINYDHSTLNRSGSPEIVSTIHEKINNCDVFIGDITPIVILEGKEDGSEKLIPNPNVMSEAGFALRSIGECRILLLMRSDKGKVEDLPFDIRHRRINRFSLNDKPTLRLTEYLLEAIRFSRNYNENVYEQNIISHDGKIYQTLRELIINEKIFNDTIESIVNSQRISIWSYKYLDHIENYITEQENGFLIQELQDKATQLRDAIHNLTLFTAGRFSPMSSCWEIDPSQKMTPEEKMEAEKNSYYSWIDRRAGEIWPADIYDQRSDEILKGLISCYHVIRKAYLEFRWAIKKNLFL